MIKRIGFTILSLILAYNTYKLVTVFTKITPDKFSFLAIIISAITFNLLVTGMVAFLGFVYETSKLLPNSYYLIRNHERLNLCYNIFGVKFFRKLLLITFYRKEDNKKYFNGTKSGILLFKYNTKQSEFGHLIAFLFVLSLSLMLLYYGHLLVFLWIQPINIVMNFYPVILQRKHRMQIERVMNR
jgi:hypothetical protein